MLDFPCGHKVLSFLTLDKQNTTCFCYDEYPKNEEESNLNSV